MAPATTAGIGGPLKRKCAVTSLEQGWAVGKDTELLHRSRARDGAFLYSRVVVSYSGQNTQPNGLPSSASGAPQAGCGQSGARKKQFERRCGLS
jgi:hypothetical protein